MPIAERDRDREALLSLLLLADPSESIVHTYLDRGRLFVLTIANEPVGALHLDQLDPETAEIRNIAIKPEYQGRGLGRHLLVHAIEAARASGLKKLIVSTGNSSIGNLAFYQKAGFRMAKIEPDYFTRLYPDPIIEDGIPCRDRIELHLHLG